MTFTYEYPRMLVTVDALVFSVDDQSGSPKILLVKRKNDPFKNCFALPGGFPEMDELLVHAAARELYEETGLQNIELKQMATFDAIGRDPRGRNISVVFVGFTNTINTTLRAGDDATEAKWFPLNALPPLAFDHKKIIDNAFEKGIINFDQ
jgi:8-oxo-dGTP diphosphatase